MYITLTEDFKVVLDAMREAVKQALELVAEKVRVKDSVYYYGEECIPIKVIDKQSIIDIINLIE